MENKYKSLSLFLLLVVCLFFSTNTANSQESSGQLFEKALYTEEVKGELQNAIDLYQQILTTYPEDRQITAKSLFQMGICYEKLGSQEAKKAYQRIIQEFADQTEVVTEARTRLAALEKPISSVVAKGLVVRQVWAGPGVDALPQINDNGHVTWGGWDGSAWKVYVYDGSSITKFRENEAYNDWHPQINNENKVVWAGDVGSNFEIFLATEKPGYSMTANAEASVYGPGSVTASGTFNELTLLLIPIGAVVALRIMRRKR